MTSGVELGDFAEPADLTPTRVSTAAIRRWGWERGIAGAVVLSDTVALLVTVLLGTLVMTGGGSPGGAIWGPVVAALVVGGLLLQRAWDPRVLGHGSEELSRLLRGFASAAVSLALVGLAFGLPELRPWVFAFLPLAAGLSLAGRFGLRKWLHHRRAAGRFVHPMLVVAAPGPAADLIRRTRRDRYVGWAVTGVCTPDGRGAGGAPDVLGVPVLGDLGVVADIARRGAFRVVSVGPTPGWSADRLHRLAWDLEGAGAELVVDPGLMETAGPRLHVTPVDGLPLLRLSHPTFEGMARMSKSVADRVGAAVLLLAVLPVMIALAVAVRADGGPVFFLQTRVGRHGAPFRMIKFRSMVVDAEARRGDLGRDDIGAGPLFKIRADPRVTRVGSLLRRYSLDELPQLFNVLTGAMSLVGPRPPLPEEAAAYEPAARRRLLVRPGMTGLWQVGGRSDLSWEESVRLDLRYVENWTLAMDLLIIWKTVGAVVRGRGAY